MKRSTVIEADLSRNSIFSRNAVSPNSSWGRNKKLKLLWV